MNEKNRPTTTTGCTPEQRQLNVDCAHCSIRNRMLFADVDVEAASVLLKPVSHIWYLPTETLFQQGEKPKALYSVRRGIIKLSLVSPEGDLRIARLVGPGAVIGLEALLGQPYQHSATPLIASDVCRLPASIVKQLSAEQPLLYQRLMLQWQQQVSSADAHLLQLSTGAVRKRLLNLMEFMASLCAKGETDFILPHNKDCAALVGARVESVSREIAAFKRSGFLEKNTAGNWILSRSGLVSSKADTILPQPTQD